MKPPNSRILTINGGSSSIKFALYQTGESLKQGLCGKIDRIGLSGTNLTFDDPAANRRDSRSLAASDHRSAAGLLIGWLEEQNDFGSIRAVGHRVVHGMQHLDPELVTQELLEELHRISPSAGVISTDASRARVRVIRTDEDLMIARSVSRILETGAKKELNHEN